MMGKMMGKITKQPVESAGNVRFLAVVHLNGRNKNNGKSMGWKKNKPWVLARRTCPAVTSLARTTEKDERDSQLHNSPRFDFHKHVERILVLLRETHGGGEGMISIFQIEESGQWLVETDSEGNTFIMITKPDYPVYVASECVDELVQAHVNNTETRFKRRDLGRDMDSLLAKYDNFENVSKLWKEMKQIEQQVVTQLNDNIQGILENSDNLVDGERLVELSEATLELSRTFRKQVCIRQRRQQKGKCLVLAGTIGAFVGVTLGFLVGGPIVVACVAATHHAGLTAAGVKGVEAALGGSLGVAVGTGATCALSKRNNFWSNRFVPFAAGAAVGYKFGKMRQQRN